MADSYYSEKLSSDRLRRVYDLATPSVMRYLAAETEFVRTKIKPGERVLELGCGYGRILRDVAAAAGWIAGIDTSFASLALAKEYLRGLTNVELVRMDALLPAFRPGSFGLVFCVQNGVSSFQVDRPSLFRSAVSLAASGGTVLFSSYADAFWEERLRWFRIQAAHGLVGEIDERSTGNGIIVCKDGFKATTVRPEEFSALARGLGKKADVRTVGGSSVFCEISV